MINYLKAPNMKNFTHGFFTRKGGVSTDIYNSLNCGKSSNDSEENINKNRKIISKLLNFNYEKLLIANQFHSNRVEIVKQFKSNMKCDAMISLSNKITLGVLTADCCPILVAHKNKHISAVIHLGWKGLFNGILENFFFQIKALSINTDDLIFALGPCIGPESYEVATSFKKNFIIKDKKSINFFINIENKTFFDLRSYTKFKLNKLGFTDIWCSSEDTYKNSNDFFSYRYSVHNKFKDYGRMLSIIKS